ncbi:MAG: hypothetical protein ACI92S_001072, partial [Planctomycetaceae bacterium]
MRIGNSIVTGNGEKITVAMSDTATRTIALDVDPPIGVAWNRGFVADFPEFTVSQLRQGGL